MGGYCVRRLGFSALISTAIVYRMTCGNVRGWCVCVCVGGRDVKPHIFCNIPKNENKITHPHKCK